ncbi:HpcH/HpaI aldolase/citrate lyase family protein [Ruania halotolerans]|uniref:HpcH/HpaI aldolase/citrate lyase family protein n=1 Tax=Ruania halotolerans TaxID=2897773 RepID=UPI001E32248B|nr:CoA ester lyase [Ruania halotolerans]UFU07945.1 CoA ester lyase [Ruania halotolerans]
MLTSLYVPGDRPDRVTKALASGADCVIVDLEDAVAPSHKQLARESLAKALGGELPVPVQVRVNACGSAWYEDDLAALGESNPAIGVRLPKVNGPDDVAAVQDALPARDVHALIETAIGVERSFEIANAGVASVTLGEADLRAELGLAAGEPGEPGLAWVRSRLVVAAAAAGLPAPQMSVWADVKDMDGLARSCATGKALGFVGRSAIHPAQLPVIRDAFRPTEAELARAREIVDRVGSAEADRAGTVVLEDGSFLDAAMLRGALRVHGSTGRG